MARRRRPWPPASPRLALDSAIRLTLQDALTAAAEEIIVELAPGAVEVRLRGRELEFVVTPSAAEVPAGDRAGSDEGAVALPPGDGDEGSIARINLRSPGHLMARVEQAAGRAGLSVNAWLVRVAAAALHGPDPDRLRASRPSRGTQQPAGPASDTRSFQCSEHSRSFPMPTFDSRGPVSVNVEIGVARSG